VTWQDLPALGQSEATVIFKSPVGDPGSRKVVVRLEVPNPGHLPAGLHGEARFGTGGGDLSPKPVAAPGSAPAPISDADIAAMDRTTAIKEWTTRKTAASKPGVDPAIKQRLEDEASKCKARFDQTRADLESHRD
jgi:hypothetical protein